MGMNNSPFMYQHGINWEECKNEFFGWHVLLITCFRIFEGFETGPGIENPSFAYPLRLRLSQTWTSRNLLFCQSWTTPDGKKSWTVRPIRRRNMHVCELPDQSKCLECLVDVLKVPNAFWLPNREPLVKFEEVSADEG